MSEGRFPTYLIIGAMKAGTSALYDALMKHPDAYMVPNKEVYFFDRDDNYTRGLDWYRAQFAGAGGETAVGEASPSYLFFPAAAERIAADLPEARLVAILRDPVARAYSQYGHERFYARERRSFGQAVEEELRHRTAADPYFGYVDRGRYLSQLQRFRRDSLLVLLSDDLKDTAPETYAQLFRFLGIDDTVQIPDPGVVNPYRENRFPALWRAMMRRGLWRKLGPLREPVTRAFIREGVAPKPMDPEVAQQLRDVFADDNAALGAWLGRDLSAWNAGNRVGSRP
ncbi:MAG: sulfotransferase domain-containing protein [Actinomycetota bacterium]